MKSSLISLTFVSGVRALSSSSVVASRYLSLRKHPALFEPARVEELLAPECLELVRALGKAADAGEDPASVVRASALTEEAREIYSFPLLSEHACELLCEEIEHFLASGLPARRPNSMNRYGVILNEIGLKESLSAVQRVVAPIARALFPVEGEQLDDHHSFCVSYKPDEDRGLDMHTDDSDVTLNVCLGRDFDAAGLTFCGDAGRPDHRMMSFQYGHVRGRALLHLGSRRHGADDIVTGHRLNLIMWNYNRKLRADPEFRARPFYVEAGAPDAVCVSFTHDRDYEAVVGEPRPPGHEKFAQMAWCPPPQAEYAGFEGKRGRYRDLLDDIDDVLGTKRSSD